VPRAEIDATSRNRFLESKDAALRERAARLFAASGNTSRAEVLQAHAGVATMKGDANAGKALFGAVCAACHAAEGVGNAVGPDLADRVVRAVVAFCGVSRAPTEADKLPPRRRRAPS
jgi:mono/diheme cytochrome c family protein